MGILFHVLVRGHVQIQCVDQRIGNNHIVIILYPVLHRFLFQQSFRVGIFPVDDRACLFRMFEIDDIELVERCHGRGYLVATGTQGVFRTQEHQVIGRSQTCQRSIFLSGGLAGFPVYLQTYHLLSAKIRRHSDPGRIRVLEHLETHLFQTDQGGIHEDFFPFFHRGGQVQFQHPPTIDIQYGHNDSRIPHKILPHVSQRHDLRRSIPLRPKIHPMFQRTFIPYGPHLRLILDLVDQKRIDRIDPYSPYGHRIQTGSGELFFYRKCGYPLVWSARQRISRLRRTGDRQKSQQKK